MSDAEPGDALDQRIARILGWKEFEYHTRLGGDLVLLARSPDTGLVTTVPAFSTDTDVTLKLVRKVSDYADFNLSYERGLEVGWWKATFLVKDVSPHTATAETVALAICRAWLLLKGG